MSRRQCKKCPWKVGTDPREIPHGYSETLHRRLSRTIAEPGDICIGPVRMMACHETTNAHPVPCVGWLAHQLGPGNNLSLRMAVIAGRVDADIELDGPQHDCFEDTLP